MENIYFVVETMAIQEGKKLQGLKPGDDGYFIGVPMAVINMASRNRAFYDVESFIQQMTDPESMINILLRDGNLFGEWGHPKLTTLNPDETFLRRLTEIYEDRQSHHFRKIYTAEKLPNGGVVVKADIKPTGPFKENLQEQLMDPNINSAFSLRSICSQQLDRAKRILYRTIKKLITFDAVSAGGYQEASKRWATVTPDTYGSESLSIGLADLLSSGYSDYAVEEIKDKTILDIFGAKEMIKSTELVGVTIPNTGSYFDRKDGAKKSIFHLSMKKESI